MASAAPEPSAGGAVDERVWRRTLAVAWIGQVGSIMGFSFAMPLIPLFLKDLGVDDEPLQRVWSGYIGAATAVTMIISAPLWGVLADRFGKKLMVLRAMFAGSIIVFCIGLVTAPWMLFGVRLLQGIFTGTVGASAALVASVTPAKRAGLSMGAMQSAVFVGATMGPLFGGICAYHFGFRAAFFIGGGILFCAGMLILIFAREGSAPAGADGGAKEITLRQVLATPGFKLVLLISLALAFSRTIQMPIYPLYVKSFVGEKLASSSVGWLLAVSSFLTAIVCLPAGRYCDRIGHKPILVIGAVLLGLAVIPQAFVADVWGLYPPRAFIGIAIGMIGPAMGRLLHRSVPPSCYGKAFGLNSSFHCIGWAMAPVAGGYMGAYLGLRPVFIISGAFMILAGLFAWIALSFLKPLDDTGGEP